MATHSSILAWRIPRTEETVGYSPQSHKESNTTEATQHAGRHSTVQTDDKSYIHLLIGTEVFLFCFVWLVSLFFYLSVCVQSWSQHASLCSGDELCSCVLQAHQWHCSGVVSLQHVGPQFPDQGLNLCPCTARQMLNHWATKEVPGLSFICFDSTQDTQHLVQH